jgi:hypothetical protein
MHLARHDSDEFFKLDLAVVVQVDLADHELDLLLGGADG